jgi:hypothetical protein
VIVAADRALLNSLADCSVVDHNVEFEPPMHLSVLRDDPTLDLVLALPRAGWNYWKTEPGLLLLASRGPSVSPPSWPS